MTISEERIKDSLEKFSFPRLSGTEHEKKAFAILAKEIESLRLEPKVQSFKFSIFYSRIYPKIAFPIAFLLLLIFYLNFSSLFLVIGLSLIAVIFFPFFLLSRKPEKIRIGKVLESQNFFIKLNGNKELKNGSTVKDIFFIAHVDSKGQRFNARIRFQSIFLAMISIIAEAIILILRGALSLISQTLYTIFTYIGLLPLLINLAALTILTLNTTNNNSKGAVDNASGLACVLELLYYFSENSQEDSRFNYWFVFTGAEETGTMGIRVFLNQIKNVNPNLAIVNNFESLGKSVAIFISHNNTQNNPRFLERYLKRADSRGYRTAISRVTCGVHTDGIYSFRKGFNLFEYGSTDVGIHMHSPEDSLENVDASVLRELCEFIVETYNQF